MPESQSIVFTIGHSNHPIERFVEVLQAHLINVLVDVRSQPYSKYAPQFNAERLKPALVVAGFRYLYLGEELGGRPRGREFYDSEGHVLYGRLSRSETFQAGIKRLTLGVSRFRTVLMCSEENPADCHRHLLLATVLEQHGMEVQHIRGDGTLQLATVIRPAAQGVLPMFEDLSERLWRSAHSVARQDGWPELAEDASNFGYD